MECTTILLLALLLISASTDAAECETGWVAYRDELCVKSFPTLITYDEAMEYCAAQGNDVSKASLVMVKDEDMQNLLVSYTNDVFDNVWLGSRYDEEAAEFLWDDGEPLTYANWDIGYPRITNSSNSCVELRPVNARDSTKTDGKWTDGNCQRRNMVICQRTLSWTLQDAINEIISIRKGHQEDMANVRAELEESQNKLEQDLQAARNEIQTLSSRVVPVGSIYIEYYNQPSPGTLWPTLQWQDISGTYAGLFFRASGGGAASWGSTQTECAPHITEMEYHERVNFPSYPKTLSLSRNGWSEILHVGFGTGNTGDFHAEGLKFNTVVCEVHPKNQAVRIWKRTG